MFSIFFILLSAAAVEAGIAWGECNDLPDTMPSTMQCANFSVPLDYTTGYSNQSLTLQLARLPAAVQPARGSILLNFGGPGATARASLGSLSSTLMVMSGMEHDLVAFDPRGTGNTIPIRCHDDLGLLQQAFELIPTNASDTALGSVWARGTLDAQECYEASRETGSLVGTAFVARDLMEVVDGLEGDGMLRYWGFSYGTTLGATVAAMFPERIDKIILDGVQNPHEYYHDVADFEEWFDSDKVVSGIFQTCVALPENCALAQDGVSAEILEEQFWDLLYRLKYEPVVVGRFKVDYVLLKAVVSQSLYDSAAWPATALLLRGLFNGEATSDMESIIAAFYPITIEDVLDQAGLIAGRSGIHCSDNIPRAESLDAMLPAVERLYDISRFMGDVVTGAQLICSQWRFAAKERYTGDFHVTTANPMLIVSTQLDAHTPLRSAYNVSSGFEGSRVLEVEGYGHSSLAVPSLCTIDKISAYFNNGTLPEHGFACEASAQPYSGIGWDDIINAGAERKRGTTSSRIGGYVIPRSYAPARHAMHI
ncbi:peptidase S33, tripeptidyl-peptidase [Stachybotrys elegans]|uniref:Peptidase S33, tripeptidyl-peptidase n=1 Tax=Stachybotrys elegans TaxID=80388 RepID=A0A8K0SXL2_9HYPO|nr:peptidase S33, tripeptidyl-peptidase [Stachybotrys elegans]